MSELSPVQEFYKGRTIFITGASGFMGKVLLEKLLYSCSDLKEIIILMRPKRGKTPEVRLEEMFRLPVFQRIKDSKPDVLKKIKLFPGDVCYKHFNLNTDQLQYIIDNTSIIFHMAATLKLEGNLKDAIQMNTTGTKNVLDEAKKMKKLVSLVHLSTAFCNCDQEVMYEKVYDFPHHPEDLIRMCEWMDVKDLDKITPNLIKPHPNTYTYSKRLAEILVRDHYPELPVIITRPSIVSPSAFEPLQGWVDNLNGPTGLMVGAGKGVIRSMLIDERFKSEVIPVDYAINGLITIAYETANKKEDTVPVFNLTVADHRKLPWGKVIELSKKIGYQYPLEVGLWYPDGCTTTNWLHHQFNVIFFHWLPAYLIDFALFCVGKKTFMIRVQNKVSTGLHVLQFFSMRNWIFRSERFESVWNYLGEVDKKMFNMDMNVKEDAEEYMRVSIMGGREYLLKEPLDNLPRAKRNLQMMYILDRTLSPAAEEPVPGWVDNLNGPTGVMLGAGKGVIRSMMCDGKNLTEVIPVDFAIKALIAIAYENGKTPERKEQIPVYNITAPEEKKVTWEYVLDLGRDLYQKYPCTAGLWYPGGGITTNIFVHKFNQILFMLLPAYFIDFLLFCFGQKRFMLRVQEKISVGLEVLQFFTMRRWNFKMDKFLELWYNLGPKDREILKMDFASMKQEEYMLTCVLGGRQYVLKEPLNTLPKARVQMKIQYAVDRICKTLIIGFFIYWVLKKFGVIAMISDMLEVK